jgi:hypothetical protein
VTACRIRNSSGDSHLAGRHELQWPECGLEVSSIALQIVKSTGNLLLQIGRVLARRAVRRDLVGRTHGCACDVMWKSISEKFRQSHRYFGEFSKFVGLWIEPINALGSVSLAVSILTAAHGCKRLSPVKVVN